MNNYFSIKNLLNFKKEFSWDKSAKISVYILAFLIPLFFLPWTIDSLDFNKQFLFILLTFLVFLFFTLKVFVFNKFNINLNPINIPVLIFLLSCGLSTIFSVFSYGSFWGWPINVSAGFLSLICFVFLYFLITNLFNKEKEIFNLLFSLILSGFLISIISILQLSGKFIFPWDFTKNISFNTIGTPNSLAIFLAILLPLIIAMISFVEKRIKWIFLITSLLFLVNLILINFKTAWLLLVLEMSIIFIFGIIIMAQKTNFKNNYLILSSVVILAISLIFIITGFAFPGLSNLPSEVSLSSSAGFSIAKEALLVSPIFGTGPGTFINNYLMFKPTEINQTAFWDFRFGSSSSEIIDKVITVGILGILTFFLVLGMVFYFSFSYLKEMILRKENNLKCFMTIGVFSGFMGLILGQFLYPFNFVLQTIFWIFLSILILIISIGKNQIVNSFKKEKKRMFFYLKEITGSSVALFLIFPLILFFVLFLSATPKYIAEVKYFKSLNFLGQNNLDLAIKNLKESTKLSSGLDLYWREFSLVHLRKLDEVLIQENVSAEEVEILSRQIVSEINNSIKKATDLGSKNAINWESKGFIYQNLINLIFGSEDLAIDSYLISLELDPFNPYIFKEIASTYISKADLSQEEAIKENSLKLAKENIEKSISLKNDYLGAHFVLAVVFLRNGQTDKAIERLELIKQASPYDSDLAFQLGVVYYNENQLDNAKAEMERTINLNEYYLEAFYYLGLIYDKKGDKDEAISWFEKINELSPGNEVIENILSNLKSGKSAIDSEESFDF